MKFVVLGLLVSVFAVPGFAKTDRFCQAKAIALAEEHYLEEMVAIGNNAEKLDIVHTTVKVEDLHTGGRIKYTISLTDVSDTVGDADVSLVMMRFGKKSCRLMGYAITAE